MHRLLGVIAALALLAPLGAQAQQPVQINMQGTFSYIYTDSPFNIDDHFSFTITLDNSNLDQSNPRALHIHSILSSTLLIEGNPVIHTTPTSVIINYVESVDAFTPAQKALSILSDPDPQSPARPILGGINIQVGSDAPLPAFDDLYLFNGTTGPQYSFIVGHPGSSISGQPSLTVTPVVPVPEPSTYALVLGAMGVTFALRRRRVVAKA